MFKKTPILLFSFFLVAVFCSLNLSAQEPDFIKGHYISIKLDSVSGYFDIDAWNEGRVFFKKAAGFEVNKASLHPEDVQSIVLETGEKLFSREMRVGDATDLIFIKQLTSTEIKLYEGVCPKLALGTIFFVSSIEHPGITFINRNSIEAPFIALFPDCNYGKSLFYNRTSLLRLVSHYQKCKYKNNVVDIANKSANFGAAFGIKMTGAKGAQESTYSVIINGNPGFASEKDSYMGLTGGLTGQLWFSKKLVLEIDMIYRKSIDVKNYAYRSEFFETQIGTSGTIYTINQIYSRPVITDIHFLQVPIGGRVIVDRGPNYQLFIGVKFAGMVKIAQKIRFLEEESLYKKVLDGREYGYRPTRVADKKYAMNFEAGVRQEIGKKLALEIVPFYSWDNISYNYFHYGEDKRVRVRTHFFGINLAITNWWDLSKKASGN